MHNSSDGKTLYAVAVEARRYYGIIQGRKRFSPWEGDIRYLHADDRNEAAIMFTAAHSQEILSKTLRIVDIAIAIGFFVEDEHGDVLSAD
jgi:hypothetical protein